MGVIVSFVSIDRQSIFRRRVRNWTRSPVGMIQKRTDREKKGTVVTEYEVEKSEWSWM